MRAEDVTIVETERPADEADLVVSGGEPIPAGPPSALAERVPAGEPIEALLRLAIERGTPVEVLERLLAIRERLQAQRAQAEFVAALARFQAEIPAIPKTQPAYDEAGQQVLYYYAPAEVVVDTIREPLAREGFAYALSTTVEGNMVAAELALRHRGGHEQKNRFVVPVWKTRRMSDAQAVAAARTFAARYALQDALGLVTADADLDARQDAVGNAPEPRPEKPKQANGDMTVDVADAFRAAHERLKDAITAGAISTETAKSWFADLKMSAKKAQAAALQDLSGAKVRMDRLIAEHQGKKGELPL